MKKGTLYLVPASIAELGTLTTSNFNQLMSALKNPSTLICVEDLKPARKRWLHWGLPREAIERFIPFNEHTQKEMGPKLLASLKEGRDLYLLSDGGTPAFCDPGRELVSLCHVQGHDQGHDQEIPIKILETDNSMVAALALSGMDHSSFIFKGFPPKDQKKLEEFYRQIIAETKTTQILMDTPYRLGKNLKALATLAPKRMAFLSMSLCSPEQENTRAPLEKLYQKYQLSKVPFVLVI